MLDDVLIRLELFESGFGLLPGSSLVFELLLEVIVREFESSELATQLVGLGVCFEFGLRGLVHHNVVARC